MLVKFDDLRRRWRDDRGASIIAVIGVMMIGFVVVAVIASATMFSITSTQRTADRSQALLSAESGRDAMLAQLSSAEGCAITVAGTTPTYTAGLASSDAADGAGAVAGCPGASTKSIVITSTGTGPNGASTTVEAVYPWQRQISRMGPAVGSTGNFFTNLSVYDGDVVVREGDFNCLAAARVNGDVYVLDGDAHLGLALCSVSGSVYASGSVRGLVLLGGVGGKVVAGGSISLLLVARGGKFPDGTGTWDIPPTEIEASTAWFDLNETTEWPGFERYTYPAGNCDSDVKEDIIEKLGVVGGKVVLDATGCTNEIIFALENIAVRRDKAVLLVKKGLSNVLSRLSADTPDRELYIIQANTSENPASPAPNCETGMKPLTSTQILDFGTSPKIFMYSPCGTKEGLLNILELASDEGQLISPTSENHLLSFTTCTPFDVPGVMRLACSLDDAVSGSSSASTGAPGALLLQTER